MQKSFDIYATGGRKPGQGASGARTLLEHWRIGHLMGDPRAIISRYPNGGAKTVADDFGIPFINLTGTKAEDYKAVSEQTGADFHFLSGHLDMVHGLPGYRTINIHPGLLPATKKRHGLGVHRRALRLFKMGVIKYTAVTMHFAPDNGEYDTGPIFFEYRQPIYDDDTAESLQKRVNAAEHKWQWWVTNLILAGQISCSDSLYNPVIHTPDWYDFLPHCA